MTKKGFVSWSGGKDSCLALYKAQEQGYRIERLFTMFSEENEISSSHRLSGDIIKAQADAMGINYTIGWALFHEYEQVFVSHLKDFKAQGMDYGIYGDIDIEEHGQWEKNVSTKASILAVLPLWQRDRRELVEEFLSLGFKAKIIVVNRNMLDTRFLGKDLTHSLLIDIEECGADACGENGEYHTVVYDGPIFKHSVNLKFGTDLVAIGNQCTQIEVSINNSAIDEASS